MENNLMIFEGNNVEVFEFEGKILFNPRDIAYCLDIKDVNSSMRNFKETHMVKLKNSDMHETLSRKLNNAGETFLTESGVYKLIFKSYKPDAEKFQDWITDEVIPSIRQTGRFDSQEQQIKLIEDEKEKSLTLTVYNLEQVVKTNPTDILMAITYNSKVQELNTYREIKRLESESKQNFTEVASKLTLIEEETKKNKIDNELIKNQQMYICNRTNFYERVTILANKYFGRDVKETYRQLYSKIRVLGSFDCYSHRKHEWESINAERAKVGKKPYKESTLNGKFNMLDVIDKFNKWELCSEAYKTIETEMIKKAS